MEDHTHWTAFRYSPEQIALGETGRESGDIAEQYEAALAEIDNLRSQLTMMSNLAIRCATGDVSLNELWGLIERGATIRSAPALGEPRLAESIVYYLQMSHGRIKIGRTTNIVSRLQTFALTPRSLLAAEVGGAEVETIRHAQFADERVGKTELFTASERLLQHIAGVRDSGKVAPYEFAVRVNRVRGYR